jgi:hypothetical protein
MKKEPESTNKPIILVSNNPEKALKITLTAMLLLVGAWGIIKLSKEMLKELEGMGL